MSNQQYISPQEVQQIVDNSNIIDYFHYLADRGDIVFVKAEKGGQEHLFTDRAGTQKISASQKGWREFKSGRKGGIIKALEEFQGLSWLEALHWLNEFNKDSGKYVELREQIQEPADKAHKYEECRVTMVITPNNPNLFRYFESRGISRETLCKYTKQIHFITSEGKKIYGIGWKNVSGGYEVKNEGIKSRKIGVSDITIINENGKKIIVFEGMCDLLSMIEILKSKKRNPDDFCLICLNSTSNTDKFIAGKKEKNEEIFLCLDGDIAGDEATEKIIKSIPDAIDIREKFHIFLGGNNDLNDYWKMINAGKKEMS